MEVVTLSPSGLAGSIPARRTGRQVWRSTSLISLYLLARPMILLTMVTCPQCGSEVKREAATYCSLSCARKQPRSKRIPTKVCAVCPNTIAHNYKYCSKECKHKGLAEKGARHFDDVYFAAGVKRNTGHTRTRLIDSGYREAKCEKCDIVEWNGLPAPLQLDHIDGDRLNNLIDNLRILCANCHAQTDTFCGKNHGRYSTRM